MITNALQAKQFYSLKETPWYFGAYLNLARHNLFLALNDLTIKLGGKALENDDQIIGCKAHTILNEVNPNPVLLEKAMDYYNKNMPFLFSMQFKYSDEEEKGIKKELRETGKKTDPTQNLAATPSRYFEIIDKLMKLLNAARNQFTHYTPEPLFVDRGILWLLNDAFDVTVRIIKNRFKLNDDQLLHLRRFDGKEKTDDNKWKAKSNPKFKYYFTSKDDESTLNDFGLSFFICLFLTKGEAMLFLKKLSGFKRSDTPEFAASLDTFCSNSLKLPKTKVQSDNSTQAGFLDMCNELSRCPNQLYDLLEDKNQKLFITKTAENELTDEEADETEETGIETKMVRKNNRFIYFALRYFDIMHSFSNMRFAVDLGTYYYSMYPKAIAGVTELRQLTRHLLGYGRLEDFEKKNRPEPFEKLYKDASPADTEQTEPWIKETYPHYHVENNNIPLFMLKEANTPYWPLLNTTPTNGAKSYPNKIVKDREPKPFAYLSANELPAMLFFELLQNNPNATQLVINNHIRNIKAFFTKLGKGEIKPVTGTLMLKPANTELKNRSNAEYNKRFEALTALLQAHKLKPAYVPDNLIDLLLAIQPPNWKANAALRLQKMKEEALTLINKMEEREKADIKPGKKAFRKIKVGKLADILAEDMMLMQPVTKENGKPVVSSKANTTAFRLLQSRLAYFGVHKNSIRDIFKACGLIDSNNPHPFLSWVKIENKPGIIEFYKGYFAAKADYLEEKINEKNYEAYHFLSIKQTQKDIQALVKTYLNEDTAAGSTATLMPRGLFLEKAKEWLLQNGSAAIKNFIAEKGQSTNSIHLINNYFENELNDKAQDFYKWKRGYKLFAAQKENKEVLNYYDVDMPADVFKKKQDEIKKSIKEKDSFTEKTALIKMNIFKTLKKYGDDTGAMLNYLKTVYGKEYPAMNDINLKPYELRLVKIANKAEAVFDNAVASREKQIRSYAYYIDNEQYLRLAAVQDKLLFMCIQKMLQKQVGGISIVQSTGVQAAANTFLLQNITAPNIANNKNILDCKPANGISVHLDYFEPTLQGKIQKDKKLGTACITDSFLKIKNAGNFNKLAKDRRLNNLFTFFEKTAGEEITLNRMILENELAQYNKQRLLVLQKIAAFEKKMYEKHEANAITLFYKDDVAQDHKKYLAVFFAGHPHANADELQAYLTAIRNGFAHNQYPFIKNKSLVLPAVRWQEINNAFKPAEKGSTKGYGVIDAIAADGIEKYQQLIDKLN